jgi:hypothetical protein
MLAMKANINVLTTFDCILLSFLSEGLTTWISATDIAVDELRIVCRLCNFAADMRAGGDITRGGENPLEHKSAAPKSKPLIMLFMLIIACFSFAIASDV